MLPVYKNLLWFLQGASIAALGVFIAMCANGADTNALDLILGVVGVSVVMGFLELKVEGK